VSRQPCMRTVFLTRIDWDSPLQGRRQMIRKDHLPGEYLTRAPTLKPALPHAHQWCLLHQIPEYRTVAQGLNILQQVLCGRKYQLYHQRHAQIHKALCCIWSGVRQSSSIRTNTHEIYAYCTIFWCVLL
jgi:hypothetical protein